MQIIIRKGAIQAAVFLQQRENVNENNILLIAIIPKHLIEFLYQRLEFLISMPDRQDRLNHYFCTRGHLFEMRLLSLCNFETGYPKERYK